MILLMITREAGGSTGWQPKRDINTLRPRQNGRHFADDVFKCIFLNENLWISLKIPLKRVPNVRINNIPAFVQIMAWCRSGDKPLYEPMIVSLLTHISVTRPQWVKLDLWCFRCCYPISELLPVDWAAKRMQVRDLRHVILNFHYSIGYHF